MSTIARVVSGLPSCMIANRLGGGSGGAQGLVITHAIGVADVLLSGH
jgi:hypothetical protein